MVVIVHFEDIGQQAQLICPLGCFRPTVRQNRKISMENFYQDILESHLIIFHVGPERKRCAIHAAAFQRLSTKMASEIELAASPPSSSPAVVLPQITWSHVYFDDFARLYQFAHTGDYSNPKPSKVDSEEQSEYYDLIRRDGAEEYWSYDSDILMELREQEKKRKDGAEVATIELLTGSKKIRAQKKYDERKALEALEAAREQDEEYEERLTSGNGGAGSQYDSHKDHQHNNLDISSSAGLPKTNFHREEFDNLAFCKDFPRARFQEPCDFIADGNSECSLDSILLAHARVYCLAKAYDIESLQSLALYKLHQFLKNLKLDEVPRRVVFDVLDLVQFAYGKGFKELNLKKTAYLELRKLVLAYVMAELTLIRAEKRFAQVLSEGGDFVTDLFREIMASKFRF
ncbi:hypothetical protein BT63DRAFT_222807 [Microthyrium microscopicum]|uniref:BTB domain-containing protein n=1 Tax=Microthyrium microscopicum TaxID=703497 RepID=A0A6A6UD85_9PEZI|nr:hypothetical protein BT63DRAFT_222807 [Microthyrium microscopicum]